MKKHTYTRFSFALLAFAFAMITSLSSCGDDESSNPQDDARRKLINTWTIEHVAVNGSDITDVYTDMKVTFAEGTLTTTNNAGAWRAMDTWQFATDDGKSITRGDGVTMTIAELTENTLVLTFSWDKTTYDEGRIGGMSGPHTFTFKR